jgi:hypothetical protein
MNREQTVPKTAINLYHIGIAVCMQKPHFSFQFTFLLFFYKLEEKKKRPCLEICIPTFFPLENIIKLI